jgi:hypothetical protein
VTATQRGSASVELALGLPLLLLVVLGGLHLGRVVMARHQLADAASYATRAAAIAARPDSSRIRAAIRDRRGHQPRRARRARHRAPRGHRPLRGGYRYRRRAARRPRPR